MFCDNCRFYQPERVEWEGEVSYPKMCQAGHDDVCPAKVAYRRDLERGEVVVPCPVCERDIDGHDVCPQCGYGHELAIF